MNIKVLKLITSVAAPKHGLSAAIVMKDKKREETDLFLIEKKFSDP
jgi:hypothetical protein